MRATISLGRWFGVPVGLHYSWFVIAWLITLSLTDQFAAFDRSWSAWTVWALSALTAVLFFVGIVLHELSHAAVARMGGVPVRGITLFALGGLAQIGKEAATPSKEFWMAIAGPVVSIAIGLGCRLAADAFGAAASVVDLRAAVAVLGWLAYINVALALFNLVPAFPLDGGRILRAALWAVMHNADRATRIAARIGQGVAFVFIAGGIYSVLTQNDFGGLWIAFIGWFLLEGAQGYYVQTEIAAALRDVRVGEVMARDCATVDGSTTLQRFVNEYLLRLVGRCFAVRRGDRIVGLITSEEVKHVERQRWDATTVSEAMRPLEALHPMKPDSSAADALAVMARENVNELPVVSDGRLEGVVTRSYLVQLLQARRELHA
jgi:Zn-dependent protease